MEEAATAAGSAGAGWAADWAEVGLEVELGVAGWAADWVAEDWAAGSAVEDSEAED